MAHEEGDIHSHNSHQSTNSTSALHNNDQRKDSGDDAASTNTEVIIYHLWSTIRII